VRESADADAPDTRLTSGMRTNDAVVSLPLDEPLWEQVFTVAPLVIVGTLGDDGAVDLAPKHMAMPIGWSPPSFGFVCTPRHTTHTNAVARGAFTVSFPKPAQVVKTSLTATARGADGAKPALTALETFPARVVDGVHVAGAYLFLECELDRVLDGFGDSSLVIGRIVAAAADEEALRSVERDDADIVRDNPLLAYLAPGRLAIIDDSHAFPFPTDFCR
jgi:flavin reductase (DIM6/NTAB) family NADH-FMN oxidoreductase RutF